MMLSSLQVMEKEIEMTARIHAQGHPGDPVTPEIEPGKIPGVEPEMEPGFEPEIEPGKIPDDTLIPHK